ncbi:rhodanese-like domain-containing protein [Salinarimonas ramus]|uniref:Rhodanese-like domain-containing protein n=1 Tax=Salinarimonas ramus TaxID=690164 RepID=A0A917Q6L4_9HYPH|nr:rhodanese-like domain-containing protein [Salinarimonas ramus]GGK23185.1 rhodanese-like domain-containing protein [Salinarimonas ramus]
MTNEVTRIPAAPPTEAAAHFGAKLAFETDCDDVHTALAAGAPGFVLFDVRGPNAYGRGHLPGAANLPRKEITAERLAAIPAETPIVVYCAGPHCNGADKAALALARLERPVKIMIGGVTGWLDEGFPLVDGPQPGSLPVV